MCEDNKEPAMDAGKCVRELLAKQPEGWSATRQDVKDMTELAQRMGREQFLAAGQQFIRKPPERVDGRTTCPWMLFPPNVNTYVRLAREAVVERQREEAARISIARQMALLTRRSKVQITSVDKEEFLISLPQEDRDYITAVDAATTLEECPADNGKDYERLRYEFMCKRREQPVGPNEPPAEDFLLPEQLLTVDQLRSEIAGLAFKPIAEANMKAVIERKAKTAEAQAQLEKDIEANDF